VVNTIRGPHEYSKEPLVVQKVLISLLYRFNPKISSNEDMINLKSLTLDQLLSTLTAYEMRISNGKYTTKHSTLKED